MNSNRADEPAWQGLKAVASAEIPGIARRLETDGYALIRGAVDPDYCTAVGAEVVDEYQRLIRAGWKFAAGGRLMKHLAFKPSRHGPQILSMLRDSGYVAAAEHYVGSPLEAAAYVGNMNLPGSRNQEIHQDRYDPSFSQGDPLVFNVLLTETTADSGATDMVPGSMSENYRSLHDGGALGRLTKFVGSPGDLVIRRSAVWHRGTANHSKVPRPMFGVIMRLTDTPLADPPCEGPIEFSANRFYGRYALLREFAAVYGAPVLHVKRRVGRSVRG